MMRRLLLFFALTFILSWTIWLAPLLGPALPLPLLALGGFGPALAALIAAVVYRDDAHIGLRALWRRLTRFRIHPAWYAVALFGPALLFLLTLALGALLGIVVDFDQPPIADLAGGAVNPWVLLLPFFLYTTITVLGEELGWRGYALPLLLRRSHPAVASLVLGVVWGVWHLPLAWLPELAAGIVHIPLLAFLIDIVAASMLYTWAFRGSGGSLLIILLLHVANNVAAAYIPILPPAAPLALFYVNVGLKWVAATTVIIYWNRQPAG